MFQFFRSTLPVFVLLLVVALYASAAMPAQDAPPEWVYVGTQDHRIETLQLDTSSGELEVVASSGGDIRPTWLMAHPRLPVLYAVDDQSSTTGSVTAFGVNRETGCIVVVRPDQHVAHALPLHGHEALTDWRRLPFLDPGLAPELLPSRWPGVRAAATFFELQSRLAGPAHRFVEAARSH